MPGSLRRLRMRCARGRIDSHEIRVKGDARIEHKRRLVSLRNIKALVYGFRNPRVETLHQLAKHAKAIPLARRVAGNLLREVIDVRAAA